MAVKDTHRVGARLHPALAGVQVDRPVAQTPRFHPLDATTEGLGDCLVAEADPDRGGPGGVQIANQVQEVVDPGLVLVHPADRPGDQPRVLLVG